jgi:hypothetical protein
MPDDPTKLRELVERLLGAHLDVGTLPESLPLAVPLPPRGRILGCATHPPRDIPGQPNVVFGERHDVVMEAPRDVVALRTFFEVAFVEQGWRVYPVAEQLREMMAKQGLLHVNNAARDSVTVSIKAGANAINEVRIRTQPYIPEPAQPGRLQLPELRASASGRMRQGCQIHGDGFALEEWTLETADDISAVTTDFAAQLTRAGWRRSAAGTGKVLNWIRWSFPQKPDHEGWLLVLRGAEPNSYEIDLRRSSPPITDDGRVIISQHRLTRPPTRPDSPSPGGAEHQTDGGTREID